MHAPVDQRAAARDFLGGKRAAQTGNGPVRPEGNVHVVHFAQLALVYILLYQVHIVVKAVHYADVEYPARFPVHFEHLFGFFESPGGRLFAQHVLARPHGVYGDLRVHAVGSADGDRRHFRVVYHIVIIRDRYAAAVLFDALFRFFGNDVAKILDLSVRVLQVVRDMRGVCDGAAADNANFHVFTAFQYSDGRPGRKMRVLPGFSTRGRIRH